MEESVGGGLKGGVLTGMVEAFGFEEEKVVPCLCQLFEVREPRLFLYMLSTAYSLHFFWPTVYQNVVFFFLHFAAQKQMPVPMCECS